MRRKKWQSYILSVLFMVLSIFLTPMMYSQNTYAASSGAMGIHFIDVGQGLSILVQSEGQNLVFDGGDRKHSSFVVSYLQQQNIDTIDYLISSHYDEDHVSGLVGCLNSFSIDYVIGADYVQDTKIYESFIDAVHANGLVVEHPAVGTEFSFGSGKFTILAPSEIGSNDNDNSVAIKLENGNNSFVFTGDAESHGEENICSSGIDLSCDVIVPGHHGSATATTWDLLQETVPEYAVISCGTDNHYGHPHQDTMDKLEAMGIQVFRTDKQGTIIALSDGDTISWNQNPCNDYTSGDDTDFGTQPQESSSNSSFSDWEEPEETASIGTSVWISATGSKYHSIPDCGNMNPDKATQMSQSDAESMGYDACKKCW